MPLRSHNILALLRQIGNDLAQGKEAEDSAAFAQLVGGETPWSEVFACIDSIADSGLRQKLRALEFDYTLAFVRNQLSYVLPRPANDVWALERTSYLTGLFSNPFALWDEYCAALDTLEADMRTELEERALTPRRLRNKMEDAKTAYAVIDGINTAFFGKNSLHGDDGAIHRLESHSAQMVLCQKVPGIPLALCVLYLIAANRLGLPIYGVNTPGRFLLKWLYGHLEFFIDVFDSGNRIERSQIESVLAASTMAYSPRLLEAVPFDVITRRALANLVALAVRSEDNERARKLEALARNFFGY